MFKIPCYKHEGSYVQFINPEKESTQFICDLCQQDLFDSNPKFNFSNLININRGLKSPEFLFSKLDVSDRMKNIFGEYSKHNEISLNNQMKYIESLISDIQNGFTKMLEELQQNIKLFLDTKSRIQYDLEQTIKFSEFKSIINKLEQLGDSINPQAIQQAETDVHQYFQKVSQQYKQLLIKKVYENFEMSKLKFKNEETSMCSELKKLEFLLQSIILKHNEFCKQLSPIPSYGYILNNQFYDRIINEIEIKSSKKIKNSNLIFYGYQDGLNAKSFWNICNGKSNLLMVFLSSTNAIFGGYSPCKWVCEQANHLDQTLSTFLFSQDKNEIYYQRKDIFTGGAICCNIQCGPIFGAGHDLYIAGDFTDGYSKLGQSFQRIPEITHGFFGSDNYLFGQKTPGIIECQIFEITFQ